MRTLSEFGFVYARYNKAFKFGDVAKKFINNEIDVQEAYSVQAIKYNRRSPYKNVLNDFNYFRFIIEVLKKLDVEGKKLSYNQFIISMFSRNGNVDEYLDIIKNNKFPTTHDVYTYLIDNYGKQNDPRTVLDDYPDAALRILRITGFINIINKGITLIELNKNNIDYIDKLFNLQYDLTEKEKNNDLEYFNRINVVTDKELEIIKSNREEYFQTLDYNIVLKKIIKDYNLTEDEIIYYIDKLCHTKRVRKEEFKYIADPLQFEFYISLLMCFAYGDEFEIRPNYKTDDYGMPISHAPGNIGDIEISGSGIYWLIEATLIKSKVQQINNETVNLFRHIDKAEWEEKYLSLVAPIVHEDTQRLYNASIIDFLRNNVKNFAAKPYDIDDFIDVSKSRNNFTDMKEYTKKIKEEMIKALMES